MGKYAERTVGELVAEQPSRSRFFEKLGIDFCCGGKKSLATACSEIKKDLEIIEIALSEFDSITPMNDEPSCQNMSTLDLVDHIVTKHHHFLNEELPRLSILVAKIENRHGESHPELKQLHKLFEVFKISLEGHLLSEENVMFPAIRELVENTRNLPEDHTAETTLKALIQEHDVAGADLVEMRKLTLNYMVPADGCNTYRATMEGLEALEKDVHQHVHKENNILFPRVSELLSKVTTVAV